jgi:hypothetical protein
MRGFTLLPVVLAMSILAAIAFLLNRDKALNTRMLSQHADVDRARYAAEAGLQAANFAVQAAGCGGIYPISGAPVTNANFGGGSYSAYSTTASGSPLTLVSTGSYNGASVTLTRANVFVYQPRRTLVVQPSQNSGQDTFIDWGQERNFGGDSRIRLQSARYSPLLKFSLSDRPAGSRVVPWYDTANARLQPGAVLSLYQYDISSSSTGTVTLNAHPVTRSWLAGTRTGGGTPNGATWITYDGVNPWPAPGMGYAPTPLASTPYVNAIRWVDWDLTDAVNAWLSGIYPNHGIWIVESGGTVGNTAYVSSNDNSNSTFRPKLTLSVQEPCGAGLLAFPVGADTYLKSGSDQNLNFGGATLVDVNQQSPERRILLRFDVSSIPGGTTIKSAIMRLYSSNVTSATNNPKSVNAYFIMQSWVEGTLNGSGTANGATWLTRDGTSNWSTAGGNYYSDWAVPGKEEASGSSPLPGEFRQGWVTFDITAAVQYWVDNGPGSNNGMLVRMQASTSDIVEFDSRESTAGRAPQLVVVSQ